MINRNLTSDTQYGFSNLLLLLLLIYISSDTLMFGTNGNLLFINLRYAFSICILIFLLLQFVTNKFRLAASTVLPGALAIIMLLFSALVNNDFKGGYAYKIILILLVTLFASKIRFEEFVVHYDNIMYILTITSLIGFMILVIAPNVLKILPIIYNTNNVGYYNALVTVLKSSNDNIISRNYGIFREPGIFQEFLIIALIFQLFAIKKMNIVRSVLYILALITTFSTTAYLALAGVLVAFFLSKSKDRKESKGSIVILCFLLLTYALVFTDLLSIDGPIFAKFSAQGSGSVIARFASFRVNIILCLRSPLVGVGLFKVENAFRELTYQLYGMYSDDNTNCILLAFAAHGIIFGLYCVAGIYKYIRNITGSRITRVALFAVMMLLFASQNMSYSFIFYSIITYGYHEKTIIPVEDEVYVTI
jgi:hypothetical protein